MLAFHPDSYEWKVFVVIPTDGLAALSAEGIGTLQASGISVNLETVQDGEQCPRFVNTALNTATIKKRKISLLMNDHQLLKKSFIFSRANDLYLCLYNQLFALFHCF